MREKVFKEKHPVVTINDKLVKEFPSCLNPGTMIRYVKVYKHQEENYLSFSEEEGDEVIHHSVIDDGSLLLGPEQVKRASQAVAQQNLTRQDGTGTPNCGGLKHAENPAGATQNSQVLKPNVRG